MDESNRRTALRGALLSAVVMGTVSAAADGRAPIVGDVMPFYDEAASEFHIYYLRDVWDDATHRRHPWNALTTARPAQYEETGEKLSCSPDPCDQDYAIGTGSVIKDGATYFAFYTGHNPNSPSTCAPRKEGIMRATSSSAGAPFSKSAAFETLYAPVGQGFDEKDNFRDPFVFKAGAMFHMLVSARKIVAGTWRGVLVKYVSSDLASWTYAGIAYDGGAINYFMMECPSIFRMGETYYLLFSDMGTKRVLYRRSASIDGPWGYPVGPDILAGAGYAAVSASDGTNRHLWGWEVAGTKWAGRLIENRITRNRDGDLIVAPVHPAVSLYRGPASVRFERQSVRPFDISGRLRSSRPGPP